MRQQNNNDISHIQVPDSFIQEVLNETQPLKEGREEVHPQKETVQTVSEDGEIVKLLSLLFEEFDKLNSRLDRIQESINETNAGGLGVGPGSETCPPEKPSRRRRSSKATTRSRKTESTHALAQLLARRTGR
jgi:hypothetical protein